MTPQTTIIAVGLIIGALSRAAPASQPQCNEREVLVPDAGRLTAVDGQGNACGACPLLNTGVQVAISGFFARVTVHQDYTNPYDDEIEAVYTFPLGHNAAVDRMCMAVGPRIVEAEIKERQEARQIYESARDQGYVASLLEQERPNIFTQSVANIEPGAKVTVEISYVEVLEPADGAWRFDFPLVVGPRYIPGRPRTSAVRLPNGLRSRKGLIRTAPCELTVGPAGDVTNLGTLQPGKLNALLNSAHPIEYPGDAWWGAGDATGGAGQSTLWHRITAYYGDGSREFGELYTDGTGQLNARWFFFDHSLIEDMGTGFAQSTDHVPDADRITPQPVRPEHRAGHDISIEVTIDSGGPAVLGLQSESHHIVRLEDATGAGEHLTRVHLKLADADTIPNRDFVLSWRLDAERIQEAILTHAGANGGFFTMILQPPDRIEDAQVCPRELIFVMDTSGSMSGLPIEKSKEVMTRALDAMRPGDTFNLITFAGDTDILWNHPKPATQVNRETADAWIAGHRGCGGTEMMRAIHAALCQDSSDQRKALTPCELANVPADGRQVLVAVPAADMSAVFKDGDIPDVVNINVDGSPPLRARIRNRSTTTGSLSELPSDTDRMFVMRGRWITRDGRRLLDVEYSADEPDAPASLIRIVVFLTDGYVGNDMAIIDAVKNNAHTTRVFSFGIGDSVNRYLLDGMARAGRGEVEYVLLGSNADAAVDRFVRRIQSPLLTDIHIEFDHSLEVVDILPKRGGVPDLFDARPLIIHGRYTKPGAGVVAITGSTGNGPFRRTLDLVLPESQPAHDVISTLWARRKIESLMNEDLAAAQHGLMPAETVSRIVAIGKRFHLLSQYTSFVAVEKTRLNIRGRPVLVPIPIETPSGVSFCGVREAPAEPPDSPSTTSTNPGGFSSPSGGGGSIFGDPEDDPDRMSEQEQADMIVDVIREFVRPDSWVSMGGDEAEIRFHDGALLITTRASSPEARLVVRQAESMVADLAIRIPDIRRMLGPVTFQPLPSNAAVSDRLANTTVHLEQATGNLSAVIELIMQVADVAVYTDWRAINPLGVSRNTQVNIPSQPTTARDLLVAVLDQLGPESEHPQSAVRDGVLVISAAEYFTPETFITIYSIQDLLHMSACDPISDYEVVQRILDLVTENVDPHHWVHMGGDLGLIRYLEGHLIVRTTAKNQERISILLSGLRRQLGLEEDQLSGVDDGRMRRLARIVDSRLLAFARGAGLPDEFDAGYRGLLPPDATCVDGGVLVAVLTTDLGATTLSNLEGAGLNTEVLAHAHSFVVGVIPLGLLEDLALTDGVRRVEPVRLPATATADTQ